MKKASDLFGKVDIELLEKQKLQKQLIKVQKEIDKLGIVSVLELGWQTQRYARASRKLDYLSMGKMELIQKIEEWEEKN